MIGRFSIRVRLSLLVRLIVESSAQQQISELASARENLSLNRGRIFARDTNLQQNTLVKLLRATPYNKKPKRSKTTAQLADRSQASIVANQICRLKWMPLNKITSDIRRSRRGLELCGLASLQNKERQFCVFLPEKGFPACNVFVQTDSQQAAQIIVRLFSFCWFRNRTTKSVRGIMNSDPGNQDVQPRTLPAFFGVGLRQR